MSGNEQSPPPDYATATGLPDYASAAWGSQPSEYVTNFMTVGEFPLYNSNCNVKEKHYVKLFKCIGELLKDITRLESVLGSQDGHHRPVDVSEMIWNMRMGATDVQKRIGRATKHREMTENRRIFLREVAAHLYAACTSVDGLQREARLRTNCVKLATLLLETVPMADQGDIPEGSRSFLYSLPPLYTENRPSGPPSDSASRSDQSTSQSDASISSRPSSSSNLSRAVGAVRNKASAAKHTLTEGARNVASKLKIKNRSHAETDPQSPPSRVYTPVGMAVRQGSTVKLGNPTFENTNNVGQVTRLHSSDMVYVRLSTGEDLLVRLADIIVLKF